jgi:hypothetical protein
MIALAGSLSITSSGASAMPAIGAAIALAGPQVDDLVSVAAKKKRTQAQTATQGKLAACPADQTRSNRTGNCIPQKSQY